jgi:hypothetical protein
MNWAESSKTTIDKKTLKRHQAIGRKIADAGNQVAKCIFGWCS